MDFIKVEADLVAEVEEYKRYISERILWVRSAPVIGVTDFHRGWEGLVKLVDADQCVAVARELAQDVAKTPGVYLGAALVLVPLLIGRRRLRRRIETDAELSPLRVLWPPTAAGGSTVVAACPHRGLRRGAPTSP